MLPLSRQDTYREEYRRLRPGWQPSGPRLEAWVRERVGPGRRVLDLGCGRGGVLELFWQSVRRAVGVDPDWESLASHRARAGEARMPLAAGVGEALPFADGTFDLVIALWVLEHLAQPERTFREVRRVLAPGGRFIGLTPNARHPLILFNRFSWAFPALQRLLIPRLYGRTEADTFRVRYRANTPERLRSLAAASGLQTVRLQVVKDPSYLAFNAPLFQLSVWLEDVLPAAWGVHLLGEWERG